MSAYAQNPFNLQLQGMKLISYGTAHRNSFQISLSTFSMARWQWALLTNNHISITHNILQLIQLR